MSGMPSTPTILLAVVALAVVLRLVWILRRRRNWRSYVASDAFLQSREWAKVRYQALRENDGRCECCGRGKHDGVRLAVDHVRPRHRAPELALDVGNLQVLCSGSGGCNSGKGGWDETDWRHSSHPHRR